MWVKNIKVFLVTFLFSMNFHSTCYLYLFYINQIYKYTTFQYIYKLVYLGDTLSYNIIYNVQLACLTSPIDLGFDHVTWTSCTMLGTQKGRSTDLSNGVDQEASHYSIHVFLVQCSRRTTQYSRRPILLQSWIHIT